MRGASKMRVICRRLSPTLISDFIVSSPDFWVVEIRRRAATGRDGGGRSASGGALGNPLARVFEAGGAGTDEMLAPVALSSYKPGALEHTQMARDGWQGNAKGPGERGDAALPVPRKMVNDAAASWVGKRREDRRNLFLIVNHGVKYRMRQWRKNEENS